MTHVIDLRLEYAKHKKHFRKPFVSNSAGGKSLPVQIGGGKTAEFFLDPALMDETEDDLRRDREMCAGKILTTEVYLEKQSAPTRRGRPGYKAPSPFPPNKDA